MPDGQQNVLGVHPSSLAGRAKIVVGTDGTLETRSNHRPLAAVTGDIRVQHLGRGHWVGQRTVSSGWGRRVAKPEWREGMKREVPTVLLLLWNNSEKQATLFLVPTHQTSTPLFLNRFLILEAGPIFITTSLNLPKLQIN